MAHPTTPPPISASSSSSPFSANNASPPSFDFPCNDYSVFKDQLLKSRKLDDNIIYFLNKTDNRRPESHFVQDKYDCGEIWQSLERSAKERRVAIDRCIEASKARVAKFEGETVGKQPARVRGEASSSLRLEQKTLVQLQMDRGVEDVLRENDVAQFMRKCRGFTPKT